MRIISGTHGGRRINPPAKMPHTRPTTDIAKEGLFNILQNRIDFEGIKTLDLFGGTGSISYEFASRGAGEQTIVEKDPTMAAFIRKTAESLGIQHLQVVQSDVFKFLEHCNQQYDLIFAGPPYALTSIDDIPKWIHKKQLLTDDGWFILEHTPRNDYKKYPGFVMERNYGTTLFTIFEKG